MSTDMLGRAAALAGEYAMFPPGSVVLCAVSGGADSVCLLHWLARQKDITLHAAHFDHGLRGEESAGDAEFVREICGRWGVPFHLGRADVSAAARAGGTGIEETARQLRYAFLEETARELGAGVIATAHTADDNAETLLLNLLRGTGIKGLAGIPVTREAGDVRIVRPLLTTTRAEILSYLEANGVGHREDASNADETYARNKIRRQVMPVLKELNPRAVERMGETARQLRELDEAMDRETGERLAQAVAEGERVTFPLAALREAPPSLRPRMVQGLLDRLGAGRKDFGAVHFEAILTLKPGGHLDLPSDVTVESRKGYLVIERGNNHSQERKKRRSST